MRTEGYNKHSDYEGKSSCSNLLLVLRVDLIDDFVDDFDRWALVIVAGGFLHQLCDLLLIHSLSSSFLQTLCKVTLRFINDRLQIL